MKRIFIGLLALALLVGACACAKRPSQSEGNTSSDAVTSANADDNQIFVDDDFWSDTSSGPSGTGAPSTNTPNPDADLQDKIDAALGMLDGAMDETLDHIQSNGSAVTSATQSAASSKVSSSTSSAATSSKSNILNASNIASRNESGWSEWK